MFRWNNSATGREVVRSTTATTCLIGGLRAD